MKALDDSKTDNFRLKVKKIENIQQNALNGTIKFGFNYQHDKKEGQMKPEAKKKEDEEPKKTA